MSLSAASVDNVSPILRWCSSGCFAFRLLSLLLALQTNPGLVLWLPLCLQGLEDQLLAEVVRQERPELEEQRDRLVVSIAADKRQLQELEVSNMH